MTSDFSVGLSLIFKRRYFLKFRITIYRFCRRSGKIVLQLLLLLLGKKLYLYRILWRLNAVLSDAITIFMIIEWLRFVYLVNWFSGSSDLRYALRQVLLKNFYILNDWISAFRCINSLLMFKLFFYLINDFFLAW